MNAITNAGLAVEIECVICLEDRSPRQIVVLNCNFKHEICLECARGIFGNIKEKMVETSKLCPFRCSDKVTFYENQTSQDSAKKTKKVFAQVKKESNKKSYNYFSISGMVLREAFNRSRF